MEKKSQSKMNFLWERQKTPQELVRENCRKLERTMCRIESEREKLEEQQEELKVKIRDAARRNGVQSAKVLAKNMVRTRKGIEQFHVLHAQLLNVHMQLESMSSVQAIQEAMKGATISMMKMNRSLQIQGMQNVMKQFEIETEKMDMKMELVDEALEGDGDEEEEDELVSQILEEIGISVASQLAGASTTQPPPRQSQQASTAGEQGVPLGAVDMSFLSRLDDLQKK